MRTQASVNHHRSRYLTVGAGVGAAVVFIVGQMFEDVIRLVAGALIGAVSALLVWTVMARAEHQRRARLLQEQTRDDLVAQARQLQVEGAASMTKAELAEAITVAAGESDPTGELLVEAAAAVSAGAREGVVSARRRLGRRNGHTA